MLIIYSEKVKNKCGRGKNKSGFIQGAPGVVRIRCMYHFNIYSLIVFEIFWIFYITITIRCQYRNLAKDKPKPEANTSQSQTLFSACSLHSPTVQQLTLSPPSLKFWYSLHFVYRHLWKEHRRAPASASFTLLHIQRKLQRRIHDGICSKWIINILSLHGNFFSVQSVWDHHSMLLSVSHETLL